MSKLLRALLVISATIVATIESSGTSNGSSIAFHEWLKHDHPDSLALPRLHEPVPLHVPDLSNRALIHLWEENQYAPTLRNAAIEVQLAHAVVEWRDQNPTRFDQFHPTLGRLISDPSFFQYALSLYRSHTARFVHYHHELIPVIRGYAMMLQPQPRGLLGETFPPPPAMTLVSPQPSGLLSDTFPPPPAITLVSPPPGGTVTVLSSPPGELSVPAPPSLLLMLIGLGYVMRRLRAGAPRRATGSS